MSDVMFRRDCRHPGCDWYVENEAEWRCNDRRGDHERRQHGPTISRHSWACPWAGQIHPARSPNFGRCVCGFEYIAPELPAPSHKCRLIDE